MNLKALSTAALAGLALSAVGLHAEPFVFQGQLSEGGAPADGIYDLEFLLYSDDIGGTQIGSTVTLEDRQVEDGNFSVELDFGNGAFNGTERWIEIRVREGASIGGFTDLSPRAKVGSAPQASYANRAGTADTITDSFWTQAPGVLIFGEHNGNDQFFFNRDRVIESSDVMVVQSSMNGPGGFTFSTYANGMPYFGYATGGFMRAKTYYDPVTDAWVVNKGGSDMLEIDDNDDVVITNNLIVGGTISSMGGGGGDGGVGYKSHTPDSIYEGFGFDRTFNAFAGAIVTQGSSGYLRTDIDLPHGAEITNIRIEFVDRVSSPNLRFQLWRRDLGTLGYTNDTLAESSGADANMVQVINIDPASPIVIDNTAYTYALRVFSTSGSWPSTGQMGVRSILIEYDRP
ncbi:MAG: hypothetical protein WD114_05615 [Phycisphaerales bacterium]